MIRDELELDIYTSKELHKNGIGKLIVSADNDGIAFISKHRRPVAMVMPMSVEGLQRAFEKIKEMHKINKTDEKEFEEVYEAMAKHFDKLKQK